MGASGSNHSNVNNLESTLNEQSSSRMRDRICESFRHLWFTREHGDLVVICGQDAVRCHGYILCTFSSVIARLWRSRQVNGNDVNVFLHSVSRITFETILETLYTGQDMITPDNVVDVWRASHKLGISLLLTECEELLLKNMTVENLAEIHKNATFVGSTRVLHATFQLMLTNFDIFTGSPEFLALSSDDFIELVDSQDLTVSSEDVVVDAILKWVSHGQYDSRTDYVESLMSAARLPLASLDCLQKLTRHTLVQINNNVKTAVEKAKLYQLKTGRRHGQWPPSAVHRNTSQLQNVAVAGAVDGSISVLSLLNNDTCYQIQPCVEFRDCYITMTVFDNTLYALASKSSHCFIQRHVTLDTLLSQEATQLARAQTTVDNQKNTSQLYFLNEMEWQKVTDIPGTEYILVARGSSIYFFQQGTRAVLKLDRSFNTKPRLQSLENVPSDSLVVSCLPFEHTILAFCPNIVISENKTNVYCLNTDTYTWSRSSNLNGPAELVSFQRDEGTYIVQRNGAVSQIITSGQDSTVSFRPIGRLWSDPKYVHLTGCVTLKDTLFIYQQPMQRQMTRSPSLTGIFDTIKYIDYNFDYVLPAILQRNINQK